jgi:integrase/recombinase XerD
VGSRKVKICMETVLQKSTKKNVLQLEEFFTLHEKFLCDKKLEGLRVRTIEEHENNMRFLKLFANQSSEDCDAVSEKFLKEYIYFMSFDKQYSPYTCNIRLRTIKCYLNWLYDNEYLSVKLSSKVKLLKVPIDKIQPLSDTDIRRLLDNCDMSTYNGFRDFCLIIVILDCGIRIGELALLKVSDIDIKSSLIRVRSEVSKTVCERILPIGNKTGKYLGELIKIANDMKSEFLFQSTYGGEIKKQNLQLSFRRLANKAKVKATPYQLRHTFATNAVKAGMGIFHLQKIMGHSVIQTTRQYIQLDADELKRAHSKYSSIDRFI